MTKPFNWRIFWILVAAATIGLIVILPYSLTLQGPEAAANAAAASNISFPLLVVLQIGSQVVLFGVAIWVGLSFANTVGLGLPILEGALKREPVADKINLMLPISIALGVLGALLIVVLDAYAFHPALMALMGNAAAPLTVRSAATPARWQGLLASLCRGFDEELLLRLCVMSFLVWLGRFVSKTAEGRPTLAVLWIANVLAAILGLGLGHLPSTILVPLTPLVIVRAVVLNGLVGVAAGYLYFTRGLESAILSHFSADIVLHVLFAI